MICSLCPRGEVIDSGGYQGEGNSTSEYPTKREKRFIFVFLSTVDDVGWAKLLTMYARVCARVCAH